MIGVISDTHGLVRPEVFEILKGSELIIHAGDIGGQEVIDALRTIAPVVAVRGNNDTASWAEEFPVDHIVKHGTHLFYVVHELSKLKDNPKEKHFSAVIFGHSHRPLLERRDGVLYLNPGSAGRRRFSLPISLAKLFSNPAGLKAELVEIPHYPKPARRGS